MKTNKKIIAFMLAFALILSIMPIQFASADTSEFLGGAGIENDPYLISTKQHLNNVRNYLSAHFLMVDDIEFDSTDFKSGGAFFNGGSGWRPIGADENNAFTGTFDGGEHEIKNLIISVSSSSGRTYIGLFGYNKGFIQNISLSGSFSLSVSSSSYVFYMGGIAGYNFSSGIIKNCQNEISLTSPSYNASTYVGGISGYNQSSGNISGCKNNGIINIRQGYAGGIVGHNAPYAGVIGCQNTGYVQSSYELFNFYIAGIVGNNEGIVSYSNNAGTIESISGSAGGIVGNNQSTGIISFCYNTGIISFRCNIEYPSNLESTAGGISGRNSNGTIRSCYNAGNVYTSLFVLGQYSYSSSCAGGIIGFDNWGLIYDCYNVGSVASTTRASVYVGGIVGKGSSSFISNCYNIGWITALSTSFSPYSSEGGIIGDAENINNTSIVGSYYRTDTATGNDWGIGCTPEQMQEQITYAGFDFENTWRIDKYGAFSYPELRGLKHIATDENHTDFSGGNGFIDTPFLVSNKKQLNNIRLYPFASFRLINDIEFSEVDFQEGGEYYNNDKGWTPIGDDLSRCFSGVFDGNGYIVSGLKIKNHIYAGLFGCNQGIVKNVGIVKNCIIYNHTVAYTGGVVAYNFGTIINSYHTGIITFDQDTYLDKNGGITGANCGTIFNCYNAGNIDGGSGIAGYNNGAIYNCYNIGTSTYMVIDTEIANGTNGTITNCYYLNYKKDNSGTACSFDDMKKRETFIGFDFNTVWEFAENDTYPFPTLITVPHRAIPQNIVQFAGGNGLVYAPYLISTKNHLDNVRHYANAYFRLISDIIFEPADFEEGGIYHNDNFGWIPLGAKSNMFFGVFDGNNHVIQGIKTNEIRETDSCAGLFGVNKGIIRNLVLTNVDITANIYVGAVAGDNQGYIENCHVKNGKVNGMISGGISGRILWYSNGFIRNCSNNSEVFGTYSVGGIVGEGVYIKNCFNSGKITGDRVVGGIMGSGSNVISCYNIGTVLAVSDSPYNDAVAGGIVGHHSGDMYTCEIKNCYNIGIVSASSLYKLSTAGGIIGYNTTGILSNSYNVGNVSSYASQFAPAYVGAITGYQYGNPQTNNCYYLNEIDLIPIDGNNIGTMLSQEQMKNKNSYDGFDFNNIWETDKYYTYSYPQLSTNKMGKIESFSLISNPDSTEIIEGLDVDLTGGKVKLTYDDGFFTTVDLKAEMIKSFNQHEIGEHKIYLNYDGKISKDYFTVHVIPKSITSIAVTKPPTKTSYFEGNVFDPTGMVVTAYYNNGTNAVVTPDSVTGYSSSSTPGVKTITVTYQGKIDTFNVTVNAKSLTSIKITTKPTKLTYLEGDSFNQTGMIVTAYYNNGTNVVVTPDSVTGYDSTPGVKTITVTYQGQSDTFTVTVTAKSLTSIKVTTKPTKLTYLEGDSFSQTGMVVTAYYNDGTNAVVTPDSVTGYSSTPGVKTITVTYQGKTDTFNVTVNAKSLTSIKITTKPTKLTYLEGDSFNQTGMIVTAYYNNGTNAVVTPDSVTGYSSTPGVKTITVTYQGKIDTFTVTVTAKSLTSIKVTTKPTKLTYLEGESFSQTGMVVTAYYNNGTNAVVTPDSVTGYSSTPGVKTITVTYQGQSDTFSVTVNAKTLTRITVTPPPFPYPLIEGISTYYNDIMHLTVITAYYNNGTSEHIEPQSCTISGYSTEVGTHTITVNYKGFTDTFEITVVPKSLHMIEITKYPTKRVYFEGDTLDLSGLELTAIYDNGDRSPISVEDCTITGDTTWGEPFIVLNYQGKIAEFSITVSHRILTSITVTPPNKSVYLEGDELDITGMTVTAHYNNGTTETLYRTGNNPYDVNGYTSTPGTKTIEVTYLGHVRTFTVTVTAKSLTGIKVTTKPTKLTYLEGDSFSQTGMVVTAYYNNGTNAVITPDSVTGYSSTPGVKTITVTYQGQTDTFTVTVNAKTLLSIGVTTKPTKLTYFEGEALDTSGMIVTAYYNNGTTAVVTPDSVNGYDSAPGQKSITVYYQGKPGSFVVTVNAKSLTSIKVTTKPTKLTYLEGDSFSQTGMVVTAYYNNGTNAVVTPDSVTGYSSTPGVKTITVTYQGQTDTFTVTVNAKTLTSIAVTTKPTKQTYLTGESLNTSGMAVTVYYDNGTSAVISTGLTTRYDFTTAGTKTVTVEYGGKSAAFTVTVNSRVPDTVTSGTYAVSGGYISKLLPGATVTQLLNSLNERQYIKVFNGSTEISGSTKLGTGMTVKLMDGSTVKQTLTVIIKGDLIGSGAVNALGLLKLKRGILGIETFTAANKQAADVNGDGNVNALDLLVMKRHILGIENLR